MHEIGITIFVESNNGNDKVTGKSMTSLTPFLGSIPSNWFAKDNLHG